MQQVGWVVLATLGVWILLTFRLLFRLVAIDLACAPDVSSLATCVGFVLMSCHNFLLSFITTLTLQQGVCACGIADL